MGTPVRSKLLRYLRSKVVHPNLDEDVVIEILSLLLSLDDPDSIPLARDGLHSPSTKIIKASAQALASRQPPTQLTIEERIILAAATQNTGAMVSEALLLATGGIDPSAIQCFITGSPISLAETADAAGKAALDVVRTMIGFFPETAMRAFYLLDPNKAVALFLSHPELGWRGAGNARVLGEIIEQNSESMSRICDEQLARLSTLADFTHVESKMDSDGYQYGSDTVVDFDCSKVRLICGKALCDRRR